jgi:hypothetical protein
LAEVDLTRMAELVRKYADLGKTGRGGDDRPAALPGCPAGALFGLTLLP